MNDGLTLEHFLEKVFLSDGGLIVHNDIQQSLKKQSVNTMNILSRAKMHNLACFHCASCFISIASCWGSRLSVSLVREQASSTVKPLLSEAI